MRIIRMLEFVYALKIYMNLTLMVDVHVMCILMHAWKKVSVEPEVIEGEYYYYLFIERRDRGWIGGDKEEYHYYLFIGGRDRYNQRWSNESILLFELYVTNIYFHVFVLFSIDENI